LEKVDFGLFVYCSFPDNLAA